MLEEAKLQVNAEKAREKELRNLSNTVRRSREESEKRKLKSAFDNMISFEKARLDEKQRRQQMLEQAKTVRIHGQALNYQKA